MLLARHGWEVRQGVGRKVYLHLPARTPLGGEEQNMRTNNV